MRVLVCGGRAFKDEPRLVAELDRLDMSHGPLTIIEGEATGADQMAANWAARKRRQCLPFPADWDRHGLKAGPKRNQEMLDRGRPDMVVAFPGGRGTADMVRRAKRKGVPVWRPMQT